jgi:hypothetical protein
MCAPDLPWPGFSRIFFRMLSIFHLGSCGRSEIAGTPDSKSDFAGAAAAVKDRLLADRYYPIDKTTLLFSSASGFRNFHSCFGGRQAWPVWPAAGIWPMAYMLQKAKSVKV